MVTIRGQPQGKDRPRFRNVGKFVQTYTTKKTQDYEKLVKNEYVAQNGQKWGKNPLSIKIQAFYQIPKSWAKTKQNKASFNEIQPIVKPDLDNVAKIICDALNGVAYDDDKQIVEMILTKRYSAEPRVEIEIREIL